jgi:superfamily II DNA or RNA helicase
VSCIDVAHNSAVAGRFQQAGVRAAHVDGDTPARERRAAIEALGSGELCVSSNCGLFSEGVDVPLIGAVILLRATASLALYLQMIGRALRRAPGKERAIILDFAERLSPQRSVRPGQSMLRWVT